MKIQQRLLGFITRANWVLLFLASVVGFAVAPPDFTYGILCGGLIVTINFHLLAKTLRKALKPPNVASPASVIAKYYLRFTISGILIFILIYWKLVDPVGLIIGLSVVVASIILGTIRELKTLT
ncbi:MAG: ATP synthase subunit I [Deltaproteobacteria bacterium]|nr:ATP synthase subunit I [Deltaproteobacteria bacterium]